MKVRVFYDDGHDNGEFEYFSRFNRINSRGIKEEIHNEMLKRYGISRVKYMKVINFYRV